MPRLRRIPKTRLEEPLDILELLELGAGYDGRGSQWPTDAERREAYFAHRDEVLDRRAQRRPGERPWAFWHYEHPDLERDTDTSPVVLADFEDPESWYARFGELGAREKFARRRRFEERRLTYLVLNGLLDDDEVRRILAPKATESRVERWENERRARIVERALRERELLLEARS